MRVLWHVTENIIEGSWVNLTFGNSNVKTPVKVKILTGGTSNPTTINPTTTAPTTGGNQGLVANPPGAILTPLSFNSLSTAITKGATVTSIAVGTALAGNEFSAGDKVKLVNPVTGQFQTFTVASAPSAGATSISVNSSTANFDIPVNAGMFVQLTPQAGGGGVADGDKGDITVSSGGTVWTIDNNIISNAKIRQSAGLSVIGRTLNTTGNVADITAGTDGHVLRRSGTTLGFGQIVAAGIADGTITLAKMANITGPTVLGRSASGAGAVAELTTSQLYTVMGISGAAAGRVLRFNSTTSILSSIDFTYSGGVLKANTYSSPTDTSWDSNYVTFNLGAGTGPTLNSITAGGNWIKITFTTGTSPNSSNPVLTLNKPSALFSSLIVGVFSAANANAAAQMNNFYIDDSGSNSLIMHSATNLPASTQFSLRFLFIGD